ncbi:MAG: TolB family protein [Phycisphaerales bacterium]
MPLMLSVVMVGVCAMGVHDAPEHGGVKGEAVSAEVLAAESEAEGKSIKGAVRLTGPELFAKAGEAYFDPYARWVIFQAVPVGQGEHSSSTHYSMYAARLGKGADGHVKGIDAPVLLSPAGSANTCGFFHPTASYSVIFGSTVRPLGVPEPKGAGESGGGAGYKRESGSYVWEFPTEMEVCVKTVGEIFKDIVGVEDEGVMAAAKGLPFPLWNREGYDAECAYSSDGRNIVYTRVDPETKNPDIYVYNVEFKTHTPVITRPGYDGGPFFSPDNSHICYRSDPKGDNNLQIFVAELEWDSTGALKRVVREKQVTDNAHVNWAPYWSPTGDYLLYTTSEVGHDNYEVFSIEAPVGENAEKGAGELKRRRITHSRGFDGLPVVSKDGKYMMWTSQRPAGAKNTALKPGDEGFGGKETSQVWIADVVDLRP